MGGLKKMVSNVKVQVPLNGEGPALIYDEDRTLTIQRPLLKDERKAMRGDVKAYFRASWSHVIGWRLRNRVQDQDW